MQNICLHIIKTKFVQVLIVIFLLMSPVHLVAVPDFIGNVLGNYIPENFDNYWNQATSENAAKWGAVEPTRDQMNWGAFDMHVRYAERKGMPYTFHCLIWGSAPPQWLNSLLNDQAREEIDEWIRVVGTTYEPELTVVVNEPIYMPPHFRNALGGDGETGWDWVITSFELARQYCGQSKLLINEYGIISNREVLEKYVAIIDLLKERNLVDGIGIQCHYFSIDDLSVETIQDNLDRLAATGVPIYVTELDITGDDATQRERYQEKFPVFYHHPAVRGITLWGYIQGETWREATYLVSSRDIGAAERPAMQWLTSYLPASTPGPTAVPGTTGDVNEDGVIDIIDALKIAQYYVGSNPDNFNTTRADVNCDDTVTIVDALLVAQYYVGLITEFC